jgi:hypothetical protein
MVQTSALPAASASYGESPIATGPLPSIFSFFKTISKISDSGLDSSTSCDEAAWSTTWEMLAISRYLFSLPFFAARHVQTSGFHGHQIELDEQVVPMRERPLLDQDLWRSAAQTEYGRPAPSPAVPRSADDAATFGLARYSAKS